jgi:hypothetical protein
LREKEKEKRLLQITSGCVKEVKPGAHGRQLKLRAMEKDGIKIDTSKREDNHLGWHSLYYRL